jgi:hypothetical protein
VRANLTDMSELQGGAMQRMTDTAPAATSDWTELAIRESDGLAVSLHWNRSAERVKVTVADARLDEGFEFDVVGAQALAAFYHPFAYAADRGLGFGCAMRDSLDLQPQN